MLLLGPAWGLLTNVVVYLPFTILLTRFPYTGHARSQGRTTSTLADAWNVFTAVRAESRIMAMVIVAGATSFLVGNAFQAQMPAYANYLGADATGTRYTVLLAAEAAGAVLGVLLLEGANFSTPSVRAAIASAGLWGLTMGVFPLTQNYPMAVALLMLAGVFNIAFQSMAQTLVQLLAPSTIRGRVVGLFNTAMMGLRAGSGLTVGLMGSFIGVRFSLAVSSFAIVLVSVALLVRDARARIPHSPESEVTSVGTRSGSPTQTPTTPNR
jgi:sugar phosphate permease